MMRKASGSQARPLRSTAERLIAGRALREKTSRTSQAHWQVPDARPDPLDILRESDQYRLPELLPIRYGRMAKTPFTFLRGAAAIMAADLARTPVSGLRVQAGGDCHIMNFGAFATPERNLIFDINDFDETLPAPWEWDLKRLAASVEVAARTADFKPKYREDAVRAAVQSYRERMAAYAPMAALEVWYQRIDFEQLVKRIPQLDEQRRTRKSIEKARRQSVPGHLFPALARQQHRVVRIKDDPPLIYHPTGQRKVAHHERVLHAMRGYRDSLAPAYRVLLDRYQLEDIAIKVVGVGSVGTFCAIALFMAADDDPLILQIKEASASVLEPYAGPSAFANHGERVVVGQRLMQSASDILLGWTTGIEPNRHFYLRQLRDMKIAMPIETAGHEDLEYFAEACGWALARAHARSGDPAMIAGYLGSREVFDDAIVEFAAAYADQTESDYARLLKAIKAGKIKTEDA
jgi:uncharacterized protein (DUF2252 family)